MAMKLSAGFAVILILFLLGCAAKEEPEQYIIEEKNQQPKVFEVDQQNPNAWMEASKERRNELNKERALRDLNESEEDFKRQSELNNVRRVVDDEMVVGYDPELDNPDFKEVDE